MTIIEAFAQVPLMFYISLFFLPISVFGYFTFSKPRKKIVAASANPADQLKAKAVDVKRESTVALYLGATVAFAILLLVSLGELTADYKNSRGLFAESLPAASFPDAPEFVYPPAPSDK